MPPIRDDKSFILPLSDVFKLMKHNPCDSMEDALKILKYLTQNMRSVTVYDYQSDDLKNELLIQESNGDEFVLTFMVNTQGYRISKIVKSTTLDI